MTGDAQIKRTLLGIGRQVVAYQCPHCATKLKSPIEEAGATDTCPECGTAFIVPGTSERDRLHNQRAIRAADRAWKDAQRNQEKELASDAAQPLSHIETTPRAPVGTRLGARPAVLIAAGLASIISAVAVAGFYLGRQSETRINTAPIALDVDRQRVAPETPLLTKAEPVPEWFSRDPIAAGPAAKVALATDEKRNRDVTDPRHTIAAAEKSVVMLEVAIRDEAATATGSGFVLRPGVIVTNYHVVEDAAKVLVRFENGRDVYADGYLAVDKKNDLALVQCSTGKIKPLALGKMPDKLDPVYAIGAPRGLSGTISSGIVSGLLERKRTGTAVIQTTAPISPGSSGGPLLNENAEVVGITTEFRIDAQNINFAVASMHVAALETIAEKVAQPWHNLPASAQAKWRVELRQLEARVTAAAKSARLALDQVNKTNGEYIEAWQQVRAASNEVDALRERNKERIAAGLNPEDMIFSDEWQEFLKVTERRNRLSDTLKQERKQYEELLGKFVILRQQYEQLRRKQEDE